MLSGIKLKMLREKAGLTGTELGEAVGVSQSMIAHYEAERKNPSVEIYGRMADKLGVTMDSLRKKRSVEGGHYA